MRFLDLVKYTGTQVGSTTFNLTVASGFEEIPEGERVVVTVRDTGGMFATFVTTRSGSVFTVEELLGSSFTILPNFSGTVTLVSSASGDLLTRRVGKGGILAFGQSNHLGIDQGHDVLIDYPHSSVTQFLYNYIDKDDNPVVTSHVEQVVDQMAWGKQNSFTSSVPPSPHMAKALITEGGHNSIEILPGARSSTAYGPISVGSTAPGEQWIKGGVLYERLVEMTILFLDKSTTNYIACLVMMLGESDSGENMTGTEFSSLTDATWINFKADILAGTANSYDMSRVPYIAVGMNDRFLASAVVGTGVQIQDSLIDIPNRIPYSSFISMAGQGNLDDFHHSVEAQRNLGMELFMPGYRAAFGNWAPAGATLAGAAIANATMTGRLFSHLQGAAVGTATMTGDLVPPLEGAATATATMTGDLTDFVIPVETGEWIWSSGTVISNGVNVDRWQAINDISHEWVQLTLANNPAATQDSILFQGGNDDHSVLSSTMHDIMNSDNFTVIINFSSNTFVPNGTNDIIGNVNTKITWNNSGTTIRIQDPAGTDAFVAAQTNASANNDGPTHTLSMMVDRGNTTKQITLDGTTVFTQTSAIATKPTDATITHIGTANDIANTSDILYYNVYISEASLTPAEIATIVAGW